MQDILSKFSTPAKRAIVRAQVLANKTGLLHLEPEYLLAALFIQKQGISSEVLKKSGVKIEIIKKTIISKNQSSTHLNLQNILDQEFKTKKEPTSPQNSKPVMVKKIMPPASLDELEQEIINLIRDPFYQPPLDESDLRLPSDINSSQVIVQSKERPKKQDLQRIEESLEFVNLKLSPLTQKIIERAVSVASKFGHKYIGTEHLLTGLLETPTDTIEKILAESKVNKQELKEQLLIILNSTSKFSNITSPASVTQLLRQLAAGEFPETQQSPTPALDAFATDLTSDKIQKNIDPVIGREIEIDRLINILSRRTKNNPILIGEPGVGKTAIVEGLAKKIISGQVPDILANKKIFNLDLGLLVAGTSFRGDFENRLKHIISEVKADPDIILFIDEVHNIIGAGSAGSSTMDAANLIKPALARGEIRCIGATTPNEYKKNIEPDPALERRFQAIFVHESTKQETVELIRGIAVYYQKYHHVKISDSAIGAAVLLSDQYIKDKFLPDKALDLIDEAASSVKVKKADTGLIKEIRQLQKRKNDLAQAKEKAVTEEKFDTALKIKNEEIRLAAKIQELEEKAKKQSEKMLGQIDEKHVAEIISRITKIPISQLVWKSKTKFINLEKELEQKLIGQSEVIAEVASTVRKHLTGLADPARPLGSFMFLGPSGVGKTELAKVMAQTIFNDSRALLRFDMTEFAESFNISKLIGAPAGYVGYRESGKLTEAVKNKPYSLILFDEIEKAHPEVQHLLLQVLEDGQLTDATGKSINFRNTIIVMTSNIGLNQLNRTQAIGFNSDSSGESLLEYDRVKEKVLVELKKNFNLEFLNRIDKTLVFKPLTKADLEKIVDLQVGELNNRLNQKGLTIQISDPAKKYLAQHSFSPDSGAREIRKNISNLIENPLAEKLLRGEFKVGDRVSVEYGEGKLVLG